MFKLIGLLLIIWLAIGALAANQRNYFSGSSSNCAKNSTTAVTIVAGAANYFGANPKVKCKLPQPSN